MRNLGDIVRVREDAPARYRPGEAGLVRGLREVDSDPLAAALGVRAGSVLYTVVFGDGADREVPESCLEGDELA